MDGLGLEALLVTPVQRIPRYMLLLRDLVKHTYRKLCACVCDPIWFRFILSVKEVDVFLCPFWVQTWGAFARACMPARCVSVNGSGRVPHPSTTEPTAPYPSSLSPTPHVGLADGPTTRTMTTLSGRLSWSPTSQTTSSLRWKAFTPAQRWLKSPKRTSDTVPLRFGCQ